MNGMGVMMQQQEDIVKMSGVRTRKRNRSIKESAKLVLESMPQIPIHLAEIKKLILKDQISPDSNLNEEQLRNVLTSNACGRNPTFFKAWGHSEVFGLKAAIPEGGTTLEIVENVPVMDVEVNTADISKDEITYRQEEVLYVQLPDGHPVLTGDNYEKDAELLGLESGHGDVKSSMPALTAASGSQEEVPPFEMVTTSMDTTSNADQDAACCIDMDPLNLEAEVIIGDEEVSLPSVCVEDEIVECEAVSTTSSSRSASSDFRPASSNPVSRRKREAAKLRSVATPSPDSGARRMVTRRGGRTAVNNVESPVEVMLVSEEEGSESGAAGGGDHGESSSLAKRHNLRPQRSKAKHLPGMKQQAKRRKKNTNMAAGIPLPQRASTRRSADAAAGEIEIPFQPFPEELAKSPKTMKEVLSSIPGFKFGRLKFNRQETKKKVSCAQLIQQTKEGLVNLESPESILSQVNLRNLLNKNTFSRLPPLYQFKLMQLLPQVDLLYDDDHGLRLNSSAFNNEFFAKACHEWRERLCRGDFTSEAIQKNRSDYDSDRRRLDPWKVRHFEPLWGTKRAYDLKKLLPDVSDSEEEDGTPHVSVQQGEDPERPAAETAQPTSSVAAENEPPPPQDHHPPSPPCPVIDKRQPASDRNDSVVTLLVSPTKSPRITILDDTEEITDISEPLAKRRKLEAKEGATALADNLSRQGLSSTGPPKKEGLSTPDKLHSEPVKSRVNPRTCPQPADTTLVQLVPQPETVTDITSPVYQEPSTVQSQDAVDKSFAHVDDKPGGGEAEGPHNNVPCDESKSESSVGSANLMSDDIHEISTVDDPINAQSATEGDLKGDESLSNDENAANRDKTTFNDPILEMDSRFDISPEENCPDNFLDLGDDETCDGDAMLTDLPKGASESDKNHVTNQGDSDSEHQANENDVAPNATLPAGSEDVIESCAESDNVSGDAEAVTEATSATENSEESTCERDLGVSDLHEADNSIAIESGDKVTNLSNGPQTDLTREDTDDKMPADVTLPEIEVSEGQPNLDTDESGERFVDNLTSCEVAIGSVDEASALNSQEQDNTLIDGYSSERRVQECAPLYAEDHDAADDAHSSTEHSSCAALSEQYSPRTINSRQSSSEDSIPAPVLTSEVGVVKMDPSSGEEEVEQAPPSLTPGCVPVPSAGKSATTEASETRLQATKTEDMLSRARFLSRLPSAETSDDVSSSSTTTDPPPRLSIDSFSSELEANNEPDEEMSASAPADVQQVEIEASNDDNHVEQIAGGGSGSQETFNLIQEGTSRSQPDSLQQSDADDSPVGGDKEAARAENAFNNSPRNMEPDLTQSENLSNGVSNQAPPPVDVAASSTNGLEVLTNTVADSIVTTLPADQAGYASDHSVLVSSDSSVSASNAVAENTSSNSVRSPRAEPLVVSIAGTCSTAGTTALYQLPTEPLPVAELAEPANVGAATALQQQTAGPTVFVAANKLAPKRTVVARGVAVPRHRSPGKVDLQRSYEICQAAVDKVKSNLQPQQDQPTPAKQMRLEVARPQQQVFVSTSTQESTEVQQQLSYVVAGSAPSAESSDSLSFAANGASLAQQGLPAVSYTGSLSVSASQQPATSLVICTTTSTGGGHMSTSTTNANGNSAVGGVGFSSQQQTVRIQLPVSAVPLLLQHNNTKPQLVLSSQMEGVPQSNLVSVMSSTVPTISTAVKSIAMVNNDQVPGIVVSGQQQVLQSGYSVSMPAPTRTVAATKARLIATSKTSGAGAGGSVLLNQSGQLLSVVKAASPNSPADNVAGPLQLQVVTLPPQIALSAASQSLPLPSPAPVALASSTATRTVVATPPALTAAANVAASSTSVNPQLIIQQITQPCSAPSRTVVVATAAGAAGRAVIRRGSFQRQPHTIIYRGGRATGIRATRQPILLTAAHGRQQPQAIRFTSNGTKPRLGGQFTVARGRAVVATAGGQQQLLLGGHQQQIILQQVATSRPTQVASSSSPLLLEGQPATVSSGGFNVLTRTTVSNGSGVAAPTAKAGVSVKTVMKTTLVPRISPPTSGAYSPAQINSILKQMVPEPPPPTTAVSAATNVIPHNNQSPHEEEISCATELVASGQQQRVHQPQTLCVSPTTVVRPAASMLAPSPTPQVVRQVLTPSPTGATVLGPPATVPATAALSPRIKSTLEEVKSSGLLPPGRYFLIQNANGQLIPVQVSSLASGSAKTLSTPLLATDEEANNSRRLHVISTSSVATGVSASQIITSDGGLVSAGPTSPARALSAPPEIVGTGGNSAVTDDIVQRPRPGTVAVLAAGGHSMSVASGRSVRIVPDPEGVYPQRPASVNVPIVNQLNAGTCYEIIGGGPQTQNLLVSPQQEQQTISLIDSPADGLNDAQSTLAVGSIQPSDPQLGGLIIARDVGGEHHLGLDNGSPSSAQYRLAGNCDNGEGLNKSDGLIAAAGHEVSAEARRSIVNNLDTVAEVNSLNIPRQGEPIMNTSQSEVGEPSSSLSISTSSSGGIAIKLTTASSGKTTVENVSGLGGASNASNNKGGKMMLKSYGVPLLPKPPGMAATGVNPCVCNMKAMVTCQSCGAFCHHDCISANKLCFTCLIR